MVALGAALVLLFDTLNNKTNESNPDGSWPMYRMGPMAVTCLLADGAGAATPLIDRTYGWPANYGAHAGVGIRSISKMLVAATYLALAEQPTSGLTLNSTLAEFFPGSCANGLLANATAADMLSMRTPLDYRLNAAWAVLAETEEAVAKWGVHHPDYNGHPNFCDVLGLSVRECLEKMVCPAYADDSLASMPPEFTPVVKTAEPKCIDHKKDCEIFRRAGDCVKEKSLFLPYGWCPVTCGMCSTNGSVTKRGAKLGTLLWEGFSDGPTRKDGSGTKRMKRRLMAACTYDNYALTMLGAIVEEATGKPLHHHVVELIARPLGLDDMIRCIRPGGDDGCFRIPHTPAETMDPSRWQRWGGGPESLVWPGTALIASASDLARFLAMVANGGELDGRRVLSPASVMEIARAHDQLHDKTLLTRGRPAAPECQGLDTYAMGLGQCNGFGHPASQCVASAGEWYGWGSTQGSRVFMLPQRPLREGPGPALVCSTFTNIAMTPAPRELRPPPAHGPAIGPPPPPPPCKTQSPPPLLPPPHTQRLDRRGRRSRPPPTAPPLPPPLPPPERLAGRQHWYGNTAVAALRELFPQQPPEGAEPGAGEAEDVVCGAWPVDAESEVPDAALKKAFAKISERMQEASKKKTGT